MKYLKVNDNKSNTIAFVAIQMMCLLFWSIEWFLRDEFSLCATIIMTAGWGSKLIYECKNSRTIWKLLFGIIFIIICIINIVFYFKQMI